MILQSVYQGAFLLVPTYFYMLSGPPPPFLHVICNEMHRRLVPLPLGAHVLNGGPPLRSRPGPLVMHDSLNPLDPTDFHPACGISP